MKKLNVAFLALALTFLSSCAVIGGIFKAGMAVGIIVVVVIILLLVWILSFLGKKG
jgi:hypothetical protein